MEYITNHSTYSCKPMVRAAVLFFTLIGTSVGQYHFSPLATMIACQNSHGSPFNYDPCITEGSPCNWTTDYTFTCHDPKSAASRGSALPNADLDHSYAFIFCDPGPDWGLMDPTGSDTIQNCESMYGEKYDTCSLTMGCCMNSSCAGAT